MRRDLSRSWCFPEGESRTLLSHIFVPIAPAIRPAARTLKDTRYVNLPRFRLDTISGCFQALVNLPRASSGADVGIDADEGDGPVARCERPRRFVGVGCCVISVMCRLFPSYPSSVLKLPEGPVWFQLVSEVETGPRLCEAAKSLNMHNIAQYVAILIVFTIRGEGVGGSTGASSSSGCTVMPVLVPLKG